MTYSDLCAQDISNIIRHSHLYSTL